MRDANGLTIPGTEGDTWEHVTYTLGTRDHFGGKVSRCELHKVGCRDIERAGFIYTDPCDGVQDAIDAGLAADASDIKVMPCASIHERWNASDGPCDHRVDNPSCTHYS